MKGQKLINSCPLCGMSPITVVQSQYGVHCEGLSCANCDVNARNRFYYLGLKKIIEALSGIYSDGLAVRSEQYGSGTLKMLEASSYGFSKLGGDYVSGMSRYGVLTCTDYYEGCFRGVEKVDLCAMPYDDSSLDIIAHSHVLEHVDDDLKALDESYRCLRNAGVLIFAVPVQSDFTFTPIEPEYHGDNALVYRRNGWDIIEKLKNAGFIVEVYVPPEHIVFSQISTDKAELAIDNIMVGQKFAVNYEKYQELFYPVCSVEESIAHSFSLICGQLELFVCRKNLFLL